MASVSGQQAISLTASENPSQIDLLISLHLHLWPALTFAIQNGWGTANPQLGEDKRAWLAGAVSDLFAQNQLRDLEDLEDVLEQVMSDEFEVVVDDGTLEEVANKIWKGVEKIKKGNDAEVMSLMAEWEEKRKKGGKGMAIVRQGGEDDEESSDEEEDEEEWDGFPDAPINSGDVDMDEAPSLIDSSKTKVEPEVDEDGFTKVVGKKRR